MRNFFLCMLMGSFFVLPELSEAARKGRNSFYVGLSAGVAKDSEKGVSGATIKGATSFGGELGFKTKLLHYEVFYRSLGTQNQSGTVSGVNRDVNIKISLLGARARLLLFNLISLHGGGVKVTANSVSTIDSSTSDIGGVGLNLGAGLNFRPWAKKKFVLYAEFNHYNWSKNSVKLGQNEYVGGLRLYF